MERRPSRRALLLAAAAVFAAFALLMVLLDIPYVSAFFKLSLAGIGLLVLLWLLWRAYRAFLWKVGRRLAFSYFLIGILPIPMVVLLLGVVAYLLAGFFLGHLYRDAVEGLQAELDLLARTRAAAYAAGATPLPGARAAIRGTAPGIALGYYRGGRRVAGDLRTPVVWPAHAGSRAERGRISDGEPAVRFFTGPGNAPTLASAAMHTEVGVVAVYVADLSTEISRRAGLWVEIERPDEPGHDVVHLAIGHRRIPLQRLGSGGSDPDAAKFFKQLSRGERFWDTPLLNWVEVSGPLFELGNRRQLAEYVAASLNATPRIVAQHLFTGSTVDTSTWGALLVLSLLLLNVYFVAVLMAVFLIFGLSRAVNRLSQATAAVRQGDFSVRIPVRRKDQVGDLQRSFNEMAAHLETLVATATQKELLEKELALARDLQKSLIPSDLPAGGGIEFATLFEPSAALGGDYFDVLRLSGDELAIIIADVSGHGLSTGLRMAMIKAALSILIEETHDPEEILRRLDAVVRTRSERRFFVTATLGLINLKTGSLRLTNAGHPPTYLLRDGGVEEILLPGAPLGGLGHAYGRATIPLRRGDVVVWLSDGLIEAANGAGEPLGYDGIVRALADGTCPEGEVTATEIRDRLLAAVERHAGGRPPSDDRTLLVMEYRGV